MFPFGSIDPQAVFFVLFAFFAVLVALAVVGLIIAAVVSILFSGEDLGMKAVWLILVCVAPFIGALAWFLVGFNRSRSPAGGRARGGARAASHA